jgi:peptidoglycan/LPS O-acetylase OafA/YrhL
MWTNLAMNVFMFQDASDLKRGVWAATYHGNSALWSLSYEWWFYMLFIPLGLTGRFSAELQRTIALIISVAGFLTYQLSPNQVSLFASYLIIWWAGVELAREYSLRRIVSLGEQSKTIASLAICALLWFIPVANELLHGNRTMRMGVDPVLQFRHFAAALGIVLAGFAWRAKGLRFFDTTLGPFKLFAPISYSLYLFHLPVLDGVRDLEPGHSPAVKAIVALALLVPLCYLLEVRLQPIVNQLASRMFPANPAGRKQPRAG